MGAHPVQRQPVRGFSGLRTPNRLGNPAASRTTNDDAAPVVRLDQRRVFITGRRQSRRRVFLPVLLGPVLTGLMLC